MPAIKTNALKHSISLKEHVHLKDNIFVVHHRLRRDVSVLFYVYSCIANTVDSRYLEFQGTFWNTSRYPYFDISDLQNRGKTNSITHI